MQKKTSGNRRPPLLKIQKRDERKAKKRRKLHFEINRALD